MSVPRPKIKCILDAKDSLEIIKAKTGVAGEDSGSEEDEGEVYEVEAVLDSLQHTDGTMEYLVHILRLITRFSLHLMCELTTILRKKSTESRLLVYSHVLLLLRIRNVSDIFFEY